MSKSRHKPLTDEGPQPGDRVNVPERGGLPASVGTIEERRGVDAVVRLDDYPDDPLYIAADLLTVIDAERQANEARMIETARRWLRAYGDAEQVDMASPAEVVEQLEACYSGGSAQFRTDAEAEDLAPVKGRRGEVWRTVDGKWQATKAHYDRMKRHGYAGRGEDGYWFLVNLDAAGTCLVKGVEVIA
jgi:hypothetical protein